MSDSEIRKYRPSNGTEGDIFMSQFCFKCKKHNDCQIQMKTFAYDRDDPEYPIEWQYNPLGIQIYANADNSNNVLCTAFERND